MKDHDLRDGAGHIHAVAYPQFESPAKWSENAFEVPRRIIRCSNQNQRRKKADYAREHSIPIAPVTVAFPC
jgi:hypothetical protein